MNNNLRKHMEQLEISQLELSRITKIAPSDLNQIVNGKRYCYPGWRKRISEALGIPENDIFPKVS